jgi:hypothetical protein
LGHPGAEACRRHLRLMVSSESLPCQVMSADLRVASVPWRAVGDRG